MSDLVGNPEDRFSHNEAQIIPQTSCQRHSIISGLESWSGVLEWSGVKIGVKFGVDFGVDFGVKFGVEVGFFSIFFLGH